KPFPMGYVGPEHERVAESVRFEKHLKLNCQGNRTFFTVLKAHGRRLPQIDTAMGEIKPKRARFDNFLEAQTGMEAAQKDKLQFVGRCFSNEPVAKIEAAEILARSANRSRKFHVLHGITTGESCDFDSPAEECTDRHDVAEGGRIGCTFKRFVIKTLNLGCCNGAGCGTGRERVGKQEKFVAFGDSAGTRVFLLTQFVSDESIDFGFDRSTGFDVDVVAHGFSAADSFGRIGRFKRNEMPLTVALNGEPVNVAAEINAPSEFFSCGARVHLNRLSHTDCNTFNKKIGALSSHRV